MDFNEALCISPDQHLTYRNLDKGINIQIDGNSELLNKIFSTINSHIREQEAEARARLEGSDA